MRRGHLLVVALALGAVSACGSPGTGGGDGGSGAKVASLASAGPASSASAASTRPRYRLDMTAEDEEALWVPYNKCLKEHGYTRQDAKITSDAETRGDPVDGQKAAELRACEQKYLPLVEWEKDPANPKAADFQRFVNECLAAKGIDMDGNAIADGDIAKALDLAPDCERAAAAKVK